MADPYTSNRVSLDEYIVAYEGQGVYPAVGTGVATGIDGFDLLAEADNVFAGKSCYIWASCMLWHADPLTSVGVTVESEPLTQRYHYSTDVPTLGLSDFPDNPAVQVWIFWDYFDEWTAPTATLHRTITPGLNYAPDHYSGFTAIHATEYLGVWTAGVFRANSETPTLGVNWQSGFGSAFGAAGQTIPVYAWDDSFPDVGKQGVWHHVMLAPVQTPIGNPFDSFTGDIVARVVWDPASAYDAPELENYWPWPSSVHEASLGTTYAIDPVTVFASRESYGLPTAGQYTCLVNTNSDWLPGQWIRINFGDTRQVASVDPAPVPHPAWSVVTVTEPWTTTIPSTLPGATSGFISQRMPNYVTGVGYDSAYGAWGTPYSQFPIETEFVGGSWALPWGTIRLVEDIFVEDGPTFDAVWGYLSISLCPADVTPTPEVPVVAGRSWGQVVG